jgi:hypothetical protein
MSLRVGIAAVIPTIVLVLLTLYSVSIEPERQAARPKFPKPEVESLEGAVASFGAHLQDVRRLGYVHLHDPEDPTPRFASYFARAHFLIAQYALAPIILQESWETGYIVARFSSRRALNRFVARNNLAIIDVVEDLPSSMDVGSLGVALLASERSP